MSMAGASVIAVALPTCESVKGTRNMYGVISRMKAVQQAISRGKPLIADFGERFETKPVGGHGLQLGG